MKRFTEKKPRGREWTQVPYPHQSGDPLVRLRRGQSAWLRGSITVLSELVMAEMPDGRGSGLQWHVSVSEAQARPSAEAIALVRTAFDMAQAEEDNHHPGVARHFFLVVDPHRRVACECKADEVTVTDPDGYRWTTPAEGEGECRGCEFERVTGKACPIHSGAGAQR